MLLHPTARTRRAQVIEELPQPGNTDHADGKSSRAHRSICVPLRCVRGLRLDIKSLFSPYSRRGFSAFPSLGTRMCLHRKRCEVCKEKITKRTQRLSRRQAPGLDRQADLTNARRTSRRKPRNGRAKANRMWPPILGMVARQFSGWSPSRPLAYNASSPVLGVVARQFLGWLRACLQRKLCIPSSCSKDTATTPLPRHQAQVGRRCHTKESRWSMHFTMLNGYEHDAATKDKPKSAADPTPKNHDWPGGEPRETRLVLRQVLVLLHPTART